MSELHLPYLEVSILLPLLGAAGVYFLRDAFQARKWAVLVSGLTLACVIAEWSDFQSMHVPAAHDLWDLPARLFGPDFLVLDGLNAPILAAAALLYFLTILTTQRTKIRRFSFALTLASEAILIATLSCNRAWGVVALLALGVIPPYLELRLRRRPTRVYVLHMGLFVGLLLFGWILSGTGSAAGSAPLWATMALMAAVLVRCGAVPVHCWMTDLFEHAAFGTALLYVAPITGAYAAVRLVLPGSPDWVLQWIGIISLVTAVYASGMALVQREARRFFAYLFLSHASLVLVGLEVVTPIGLTGALCVWISAGLALGGLGITLRALEARFGRLTLSSHHGLYEHASTLAVSFALTGLGSVGFPGTLGFVGTELLLEGAVETYPHVGIALIVAATLNGIAVIRAYFLLFTGARHVATVSLGIRIRERFAVLCLAALILIGGVASGPWVAGRFAAAEELLSRRGASASAQLAASQDATPSPTPRVVQERGR